MPSTYKENHWIGNTDYLINDRHTLSGRLFTATVDQLRTFGSPGGYPGAPVVPGWGSPQGLDAQALAWVEPARLREHDILEADAPIVAALATGKTVTR